MELLRSSHPWSSIAGRLPGGLAAGLLLTGLAGLLGGPAPAGAQGTRCSLVDSDRLNRLGSTVFIRRPRIRCDDGTRIRADRAVIYTDRNFTQLYDRVFYQDSTRTLEADTAQYFSRAGRLQAQGNVRLTSTADSSVLTGQNLLYLRESEIRPRAQLTMTGGRPHAVLYPGREDDAGAPPGTAPAVGEGERPAPYEVDADRIFVEGQELFRATGSVEITREELRAFGDEVVYDRAAGHMRIRPDGRIVSEGYELTGRSLLLILPGDELREVVATGDAVLAGEELDLTAPEIRLFVDEGALQRLVAVGVPDEESGPAPSAEPGGREGAEAPETPETPEAPRPEAVAEEFLLRGDSLDVRLPGEVLETVYAVGRARGESLSRDSLNTEDTPPLIRRDWLEGDTIVATFVPADPEVGDTVVAERGLPEDSLAVAPDPPAPRGGASTPGREYRLERLVASGNARTLYRLAPSDDDASRPGAPAGADTAAPPAGDTAAAEASGEDRLAIHYVTGVRITIRMVEGAVEWMEVEGQTQGIHATPVARSPRGGEGGTPPPGAGATPVRGTPPRGAGWSRRAAAWSGGVP